MRRGTRIAQKEPATNKKGGRTAAPNSSLKELSKLKNVYLYIMIALRNEYATRKRNETIHQSGTFREYRIRLRAATRRLRISIRTPRQQSAKNDPGARRATNAAKTNENALRALSDFNGFILMNY